MSEPEEPLVLTDEDGHALAVVRHGQLHPVQRLPQRVPGATATPWAGVATPWAGMSEAELLVAMERAAETLTLYRQREEVGSVLLAHARRELIDIEDELIRRGFSQRRAD